MPPTPRAPVPRQPAPPPPSAAARDKWSQVLAKLPKIGSRWPSKIALEKDTMFTLRDEDGKAVGMTSIKAGATLTLIEVKPEHAVVRVSSSICPIPVENTDLVDQLGGSDAVLALPDDPAKPPAEKRDAGKPPAPPAKATSNRG
jgi:hypothetical protein